MKVRIATYSQCFNQNRETYSELDYSLGSPKPNIGLYDDFEHSYSATPDLNEHMCLSNLEQESDVPTSLSLDLAPCTCSPKDVVEDILAFFDLPTI